MIRDESAIADSRSAQAPNVLARDASYDSRRSNWVTLSFAVLSSKP